jgi:hypothetical protein
MSSIRKVNPRRVLTISIPFLSFLQALHQAYKWQSEALVKGRENPLLVKEVALGDGNRTETYTSSNNYVHMLPNFMCL